MPEVRCTDPTERLEKDAVYTVSNFWKKQGMIRSTVDTLEEATHVTLVGGQLHPDNGTGACNITADRFEAVEDD